MSNVFVWNGSNLLPGVAPANRGTEILPPSEGAKVGSYNGNGGDAEVTASAGVTFDIGSTYYTAGESMPNSWDVERIAAGKIPLMVMLEKNYLGGGPTSYTDWAGIAAGDFDSFFLNRANNLAAQDTEIWLTFRHEPDVYIGKGGEFPAEWTEAEYIAAFRHLHGLMSPLMPKVKWMFWCGGSSSNFSLIDALYPGDDVVDIISWDPYVHQGWEASTTATQRWSVFANRLASRSWGQGKPYGLSECGYDARHGVQAGIDFWQTAPQAVLDLGLSFVNHFNRNSGPLTESRIDDPAVWESYGDAMRRIQLGQS